MVAIQRLARRVARDSGGSQLRALADIKAAVESNIEIDIRSGNSDELLDRVLADASGTPYRGRTWQEIGADLGVSAQAAQRKYRQKL